MAKDSILITGAAGNLGRSVTGKLLEEGYHIDAVLGPKDDLNFITHEDLHAEQINLQDEEAAANYVKKLGETNHNLIGAVLLVGGFASGNIRKTDGASLQKMYKLNFETAFFVARPVLDILEKQDSGGQIIFIGARPAIKPEDGKDYVAYSLSKSLLFRLAEMINATYGDDQINATVIVPSTMDTPGTRAAMPEADFTKWVPTEKVADTISFLFSEAGKMVRETVIKIYNQS